MGLLGKKSRIVFKRLWNIQRMKRIALPEHVEKDSNLCKECNSGKQQR